MKTISIILVVKSPCEGLAIGQQLRVLGRAEDTLGRWLHTALAEHKIPVSREQWLICFEGRALPLDQRLVEAIPDLPGRGTIVLELFVLPESDVVFLGQHSAPSAPEEDDEFDLTLDADSSPESDLRSDECNFEEEEADAAAATVERPAAPGKRPKAVAAEEEASEEDEDLDFDMAPEEEEEAEPAAARTVVGSAKRRFKRPMVQRHATVRYYSRMNPTRLYPLLVAITKEAVQAVAKQDFDQRAASFKAAKGSIVEVEPILPGCDCYPPKQQVRLTNEEVQVVFHVAPKVLGKITSARVVLTQKGKTLADIPLSMQVSNKMMVAAFGLVSLVLPFASALLKHFRIDFESQLQDGFGVYMTMAHFLLNSLSPGVLGGFLVGATVVSYLYLRPEKRDVFWELTPDGEGQAIPNRSFGNLFRRVLRTTPRFALYGASICLALGLGIGCLAAILGSAHQALAQAPRALSILLAFGTAGGAGVGVIKGLVGDDSE